MGRRRASQRRRFHPTSHPVPAPPLAPRARGCNQPVRVLGVEQTHSCLSFYFHLHFLWISGLKMNSWGGIGAPTDLQGGLLPALIREPGRSCRASVFAQTERLISPRPRRPESRRWQSRGQAELLTGQVSMTQGRGLCQDHQYYA